MIYQFATLQLNEQQSSLLVCGEPISLEPRLYDLLLYFCKNPKQLITKEQLIEHVWQNRIVTDNAIARAISKLRQILSDQVDSSHQVEFIKTLPRKGYIFQVDVVTVTEKKVSPLIRNSPPAKSVLGSVILLLGLIVSFFLWNQFIQSNERIKQVTPYLRSPQSSWYPNFSLDGNFFSHVGTTQKSSSYSINVSSIANNQTIVLNQHGRYYKLPVVNIGGDKLAWVEYQENGQCSIKIGSLNWISQAVDNPKKISGCIPESTTRLHFSADNSSLWYLTKTKQNQATMLIRYSLAQQQSFKLTDTLGADAHQVTAPYFFDIADDDSKILLLSQNSEANTLVSLVSLQEQTLTEQHQLSWFIDRATLSQDGKHMVHPSEHPSYQLRKSLLDGSQESLLVSISDRIAFHLRIPGTDDLVFSSYLNNVDVTYKSLQEQIPIDNESINSSVMDYLPALKNHSNEFAFVSKRSGQAEVWLATINQTTANDIKVEKLTNFNKKVRFYQLQWSPDDKHLLALTHNQLMIISASSGQVKFLELGKAQRRRAWWISHNLIGFEQWIQNQWQVQHYDLINGALATDPNPLPDYLNSVIFNNDPSLTATLLTHCSSENSARHHTMSRIRDSVYCQDKTTGKLIYLEGNSNQPNALAITEQINTFDSNGEFLVFSYRSSISADIMLTRDEVTRDDRSSP